MSSNLVDGWSWHEGVSKKKELSEISFAWPERGRMTRRS